jgi:hypothetical protein
MLPATEIDRLPDELLKPYLDRGHQGDVDRTQIAEMLRLTPLERLRRLDECADFLNRFTPPDARLLRSSNGES